MIDLDELRALCAQATAGPWYVHNPDDEACMNAYAVTTSPGEPVVDASPPNDHEQIVALTLLQSPRVVCHAAGRWEADARFIAAAREAVPTLLDENARLRALAHEVLKDCEIVGMVGSSLVRLRAALGGEATDGR
jgi:hypothetical protein